MTIQVKTKTPEGKTNWEDLRTSDNRIYYFEDVKEACRTAKMCYPDCMECVRINTSQAYLYATGNDMTNKYPFIPKGWEPRLA